eukprot:CAMPEP_0116840138 /NCGR_PEP_ID=MMETSP0418-20121206/10166_1 /TAXON_ID=1158023 /ORGANISM="Astrosyne radiata, Strain 13vi08-1A" /LENGTH=295 /DNA_ID=CAMNT_0004470347 /DNA_START=1 /DNA_END=888 /DNA_ORIENTATION=+
MGGGPSQPPPQHFMHTNSDAGVMGWSGGSSATAVHPDRFAENGSVSPYDHPRRPYYSTTRDVAIREEPPIREEPATSRTPQVRVSGGPILPHHHTRATPTSDGVDHGLSLMTSALLNMLDTPPEHEATNTAAAASKSYPSRISSSSTIHNAISPPSTPMSGGGPQYQDPSSLTEHLMPPSAQNMEPPYYHNTYEVARQYYGSNHPQADRHIPFSPENVSRSMQPLYSPPAHHCNTMEGHDSVQHQQPQRQQLQQWSRAMPQQGDTRMNQNPPQSLEPPVEPNASHPNANIGLFLP